MDINSIKDKITQYALQLKDANGKAVFTQEDFDNQYSNISILANMLSFASLTQENKFRLYKDNSISNTATDFNMARKLAKIQNGYNWKRNTPATIVCNLTMYKKNLALEFGQADTIVIPQLTPFSISGSPFYLAQDLVLEKNNIIDDTITVTDDIVLYQGTYEPYEFLYKQGISFVFKDSTKIGSEDVFVETTTVNTLTGVSDTEFVKYYSDEEYLDINGASSETGENIYYVDFFNDNIIYKFNNTYADNTKFSFILYKNDGNLFNFASVLTGAVSITHPLSQYMIFSIQTDKCSNGNNAETIDDLKNIATKAFIKEAVNDNDLNELLYREYKDTFNLNALGGDNYGVPYLGYIVFTGVTKGDNPRPLNYQEIVEIRRFINTIKGLNLRVIYKVPAIISLDYNVKLSMKLQYKGRFDEFKTTVVNDILNYVNTEIYSNPIENTKKYTFNTLLLKEDAILDYVDTFNIIQTPNYKIHRAYKEFIDTIITAEVPSDPADEALFQFNSIIMTREEVRNLYNDFSLLGFSGEEYIKVSSKGVNITYGSNTTSQTPSTFAVMQDGEPVDMFKAPDGSFYKVSNTVSSLVPSLFYVKTSLKEGNITSTDLYIKASIFDDNFSATEESKNLKIQLYKTDDDKHYLNDITFGRDTFVITSIDSITVE